jgi:hypothetical protein
VAQHFSPRTDRVQRPGKFAAPSANLVCGFAHRAAGCVELLGPRDVPGLRRSRDGEQRRSSSEALPPLAVNAFVAGAEVDRWSLVAPGGRRVGRRRALSRPSSHGRTARAVPQRSPPEAPWPPALRCSLPATRVGPAGPTSTSRSARQKSPLDLDLRQPKKGAPRPRGGGSSHSVLMMPRILNMKPDVTLRMLRARGKRDQVTGLLSVHRRRRIKLINTVATS